MNRALISVLLACAAISVPVASFAAEHDHAGHHMDKMAMAGDTQMVDATVKKVDKAAGTLTLAHGPLTNLGMPAMTMAFKVKDAAWLGQVQAGDKIRFMADDVKGALTVMRLETAKAMP